MSIAYGLTHRNNVGHNSLCLESPEMRTDPPEANLYFVGNAHSARVSHIMVHFLEIVSRQHKLAAAAHQRLTYKCGHLALALLDNFFDMVRVFLGCPRVGSLVSAAIDIRHRHCVYIRGCACAARPIEIVGTNIDEDVGVEYRHLFLCCLDHARMAMTNVSNVVNRVQVGASVLVVQVLHPAAYNVERLLV